MKQRVIGNRIYRFEKGVFSLALVDQEDVHKGIVFHRFCPDEGKCSVAEVCFTEDLLKEVNGVYQELLVESL